MTADALLLHIESACNPDHPLKDPGNQEYANAFVEAFLRVHAAFSDADCMRIFTHKFNKGGLAAFLSDSYLQSAAELSVANHVCLNPNVRNFAVEKNVNRSNRSDVDVFYTVSAVDVNLEVKCPTEEMHVPQENVLVVNTAGRVPNRQATIDDLNEKFSQAKQQTKVIEGKNKDNTLKQFLLEAANKFPTCAACSFESVNVLFVACDYYDNMGRWRGYLYGEQGLFTVSSFQERSTYENVDVVIISNLKYRHRLVRKPTDWTLENTLLLPFANPRTGRTLLRSIVHTGLSIFNHHMQQFGAYRPTSDDPQVPSFVLDVVAVEHYVNEALSQEERLKYFPVCSEAFAKRENGDAS